MAGVDENRQAFPASCWFGGEDIGVAWCVTVVWRGVLAGVFKDSSLRWWRAPRCGWRASRPQVQEESRRAQLAELADDRLKPVPPYMARALRTARRSSERAGFFVAWVSRRTWSLTHTRNMGWRAFFSKSTIRSGASSK